MTPISNMSLSMSCLASLAAMVAHLWCQYLVSDFDSEPSQCLSHPAITYNTRWIKYSLYCFQNSKFVQNCILWPMESKTINQCEWNLAHKHIPEAPLFTTLTSALWLCPFHTVCNTFCNQSKMGWIWLAFGQGLSYVCVIFSPLTKVSHKILVTLSQL